MKNFLKIALLLHFANSNENTDTFNQEAIAKDNPN